MESKVVFTATFWTPSKDNAESIAREVTSILHNSSLPKYLTVNKLVMTQVYIEPKPERTPKLREGNLSTQEEADYYKSINPKI